MNEMQYFYLAQILKGQLDQLFSLSVDAVKDDRVTASEMNMIQNVAGLIGFSVLSIVRNMTPEDRSAFVAWFDAAEINTKP